MDEAKGMTDEWIVLNAIGRAQDVLAAYLHPGPRDEKRALSELLVILDDHDLVEAHERMTWKTKPTHPGTKRSKATYYEAAKLSSRERTRPIANENDGKPWIEDHLERLKVLITENTPTRLIALKLGRTEDAISDKVAAEGFSLAPTNRSPRD